MILGASPPELPGRIGGLMPVFWLVAAETLTLGRVEPEVLHLGLPGPDAASCAWSRGSRVLPFR